MKTVWLSHTAGLDGAEHALLEAVRGLGAAGNRVHVMLPGRGPLAGRLAELHVPVTCVPYRWWLTARGQQSLSRRARRMIRNLLAWRGVRALLRQERPDLVVTNTLDLFIGAMAAKAARLPHIYYVHELYGREGHDDLVFDLGASASLRLMNRLSDRILANSLVVRDQLRRSIPDEKLRVVYYAMEVPLLLTKPRSPRTALELVAVGRITAGKRQGDAVRAVSLLVQKGLDVRLSLVGREIDEYGASLRSMVRALGIEDRVAFTGYTSDPFTHVVQSDVALICSRGEPFGRVTVEAMKLGKPVIGADSAGTRELIRDGWNGLLYRPEDPADLAAKIAGLQSDRARIAEMGDRARAWSRETFSQEKYTSDLLAVFEEAKSAYASGDPVCVG
jgi:glycosyltransferase involved in cell wall biosynthesis